MTTALCPGSFDPPTNGHIDVIERTARYFERIVVAVIANPSKQDPLFTTEEREDLLRDALTHVDNAEVTSFQGLLVDFAREHDVQVVVKGLRAISDFEYELQMAQMNSSLHPDLDTMFVTAKPSWAFLSSSLVKEVARYGGAIEGLVPAGVAKALHERFAT